MSSNIQITRICHYCGKQFVAKMTTTKYCSHTCNSRHYKQKLKEVKIQKSNDQMADQIRKPIYDLSYFEYLTVKEAAQMLRSDPRTIYAMIESGRLKAVNLSVRKIRIHKREIENIFTYEEVVVKPGSIRKKNPKSFNECSFYTIGDIIQKYCISQSSLYKLIKSNNIAKYSKGKFVYVSRKDIDFMLKDFHVSHTDKHD